VRLDSIRLDNVSPRTWLLATLAGWALLAWLLALLGMGGHVSPLADDPSLMQALPKPPPSLPARLGPLAQYAEIGARPLFSDDRRPRPFSLQPEGEGETTANTFDYVLTSVLITPGLHMAIVQPTAGGDSIRIKLGESSEAAAAWRLVTLNPRSAVFAGPEGEKTLNLRVYDGNGGEAPTQVSTATPPETMVDATGATADAATPAPPPAAPARKPVSPTPSAPAKPAPVTSPEAQMDAIRKRIEARRAQLRQQAQQQPTTAPVKNP
jgi:general secretion pathway protein N